MKVWELKILLHAIAQKAIQYLLFHFSWWCCSSQTFCLTTTRGWALSFCSLRCIEANQLPRIPLLHSLFTCSLKERQATVGQRSASKRKYSSTNYSHHLHWQERYSSLHSVYCWIYSLPIIYVDCFYEIVIVQANLVKYHRNLADFAKSMKFGMKIPKTKKKSLIRGPSENYIVWRHNDVIIWKFDVIMTSSWRQAYAFCWGQESNFFIVLSNLHT